MKFQISKWLPALLMMIVIFLVSGRVSTELPNFHWADTIIKKAGHMVGYALLALLYWRAMDLGQEKRWMAWLLAVLYALTDEFHQSFVPGRHPSLWDVILFDNVGALISIGVASHYRKRKRPEVTQPVVEEAKD